MGFRQNGVSMPAHAVWTWSPGVLIGAALLAAAYVRRWMHVRRTSSRPQAEAPVWRLACFTASVLLALAALISPVDSLADQLFCMHMVQQARPGEAPLNLRSSRSCDVYEAPMQGIAAPGWGYVRFSG